MSRFDAVGFGGLNVDKLFKVNKIAKAEEESFIMDCETFLFSLGYFIYLEKFVNV